jgi:hypothetical protein
MAAAPWVRFWDPLSGPLGPDSENPHGFCVHDAPGSTAAQRGYCAMQVLANAGPC